jgi:hypothetical protein
MTLRLNGATSGFTEIDAPAVAGSNTLLLPGSNGSAYQFLRNGATAGTTEFAAAITSGTEVASTSGTSIDFTSIPSYVKRITVMFNGVSTNGSSVPLVQLGTSGGVVTSGYTNTAGVVSQTPNTTRGTIFTTGVSVAWGTGSLTYIYSGTIVFVTLGSNAWVASGVINNPINYVSMTAGQVSLGGTLDRVRITTVNGTDTFDAGSINILYEG